MKILITGITGSLGQEVCRKLLKNDDIEVIGYSRDEQKQRQIKPRKRLTLYLGDVRDGERLVEASRGCDMIMHFAALKCVDSLEENPEESVKTNIVGTQNILHAQRVNGIKRVVLSSTDKAVYPVNVYGACKMVSEKLVLRNKNNVVVRYGNVLASRGSVIPEFIKTIRDEGRVYITDERMTRFFLTIQEAADFVIRSAFGDTGGVKIPKIKCTPIVTIAKAVAQIMNKPEPKVVITGIRAGEKLHECLSSFEEGNPLFSVDGPALTDRDLVRKLSPIVEKFA